MDLHLWWHYFLLLAPGFAIGWLWVMRNGERFERRYTEGELKQALFNEIVDEAFEEGLEKHIEEVEDRLPLQRDLLTNDRSAQDYLEKYFGYKIDKIG